MFERYFGRGSSRRSPFGRRTPGFRTGASVLGRLEFPTRKREGLYKKNFKNFAEPTFSDGAKSLSRP